MRIAPRQRSAQAEHLPAKRLSNRPSFARLVSLLLAIALVGSACSSSSDESTDAASDSGSTDTATANYSDEDGEASDGAFEEAEVSESADADASDASQPALGAGGVGGNEPVALQTADLGRDIIRTAEIDVEVDNVAEASQLALTRIEGLGGLLFGQETVTTDQARTTLVFKVQPSDFTEALSRLSEVGELRDQRITADDVTERVVNLESRIITSEASVERLREFVGSATDIQTVAELERELLQRETDLELLRGQLRTLQNQVSLATITVTLTERIPGPALTVTATAYRGHDDGATCSGSDLLEVDEGDAVTVCYVVTNTGDTGLADVDVRDDKFKLDGDDLMVVKGSLDETLAPGGSVVVAAEIEAVESVSGLAQANARPVNDEGADLGLSNVSARDDIPVIVELETTIPGFSEGLDAGWGALLQMIRVIVLVAGVVLPWSWVLVGLWALSRWNRRRTPKAKGSDSFGPPPPVAPPAPDAGPSDGSGSDGPDQPQPPVNPSSDPLVPEPVG